MATIKNKTMFKVVIPDGGGLVMPLVFQQDAAHHVWVDWGDKSYPDTYTYQGLVEAKHTYPRPGEYLITMEVVDDGWLILGGGWTGGNAVGGADEAAARMLIEAHIGDDVTGIADFAFRGCENMEVISFLKDHELTIGEHAFEDCASIEEISLPGNLSTIPNSCFYNCSSLKKVTLPGGVYEIMPNAFYGCSALKDIQLKYVTKIDSNAFAFCRKLTKVELGEQCFSIGDDAFNSCSNIRELILGHAKAIGDRAFYNAKSLPAVDFTEFIESIGDSAFAGCTSLKKIKMATGNPPILMSGSSIEPNEDLKIQVPWRSVDTYKNATNWTVLAYAFEGV